LDTYEEDRIFNTTQFVLYVKIHILAINLLQPTRNNSSN